MKPPLGVMPFALWAEANPDPSIEDLVERYARVSATVERYRQAGWVPNVLWLVEILGPALALAKSGQVVLLLE